LTCAVRLLRAEDRGRHNTIRQKLLKQLLSNSLTSSISNRGLIEAFSRDTEASTMSRYRVNHPRRVAPFFRLDGVRLTTSFALSARSRGPRLPTFRGGASPPTAVKRMPSRERRGTSDYRSDWALRPRSRFAQEFGIVGRLSNDVTVTPQEHATLRRSVARVRTIGLHDDHEAFGAEQSRRRRPTSASLPFSRSALSIWSFRRTMALENDYADLLRSFAAHRVKRRAARDARFRRLDRA